MTPEQLKELEDRLWEAADKLRSDSGLKASEYATPILGIIFLRFASIKFNKVLPEIEAILNAQKKSRLQQTIEELAIMKCGFYLPEEARYDYLLKLPESEDIAKALKDAMESIEKHKPELVGSLPKDEYFKLYVKEDRTLPKTLLKIFADIPDDAGGDVFGKVYEYFLAEFALAEGQNGGEFFTPTSVVRLMVEIIEPYNGTIFDPACGSGGMFVQSSLFVDRKRQELHESDTKDLMVYGVEKTPETVKLARMNLAINGLRGEISPSNSYYEDPFGSYERFDYVMANPPFNVDEVNLDRVKDQRRFNEYGIPQNKTKKAITNKNKPDAKNINTVPNANYLWINLFATSLKPNGRAALVMANSASDARNSEADIRKSLIKAGVIDIMLTLPKNMFYTVTLPATLWFFDKSRENTEHTILFIDAHNIFRQVTRALREFTAEHIQNIAAIVALYRGDNNRLKNVLALYEEQAIEYLGEAAIQESEITAIKTSRPDNEKEIKKWERTLAEAEQKLKSIKEKERYFLANLQWLNERFPDGVYEDIIGLCKAATMGEIEEQDYSLNPGRYVGVVVEEDGLTEEEFLSEMKERHLSLNNLHNMALELEKLVGQNLIQLL